MWNIFGGRSKNVLTILELQWKYFEQQNLFELQEL